MNFGQAISTCLGKYFTFSGRAKRSEYWWFYLFTVLIGVGADIAVPAFGTSHLAAALMSSAVSLIFLIPLLAAGSRRLHDIGKSGWWQLLMLTIIGIILLIVWWATDTKPEGDEYGEPAEVAA